MVGIAPFTIIKVEYSNITSLNLKKSLETMGHFLNGSAAAVELWPVCHTRPPTPTLPTQLSSKRNQHCLEDRWLLMLGKGKKRSEWTWNSVLSPESKKFMLKKKSPNKFFKKMLEAVSKGQRAQFMGFHWPSCDNLSTKYCCYYGYLEQVEALKDHGFIISLKREKLT